MQTFHEAFDAAETYSPAEEQFNCRRRTIGMVAAPLVFFGLWLAPMGLAANTQTMAAIMALVIVLWLSEALPIAVTAILGPMLAIILGVAPARQALAPFADPIIFLFIGSFMLAQSMFVHGVDRRIAYTALALPAVGTSPFRILLTYAAVCGFLSMWISNTATTAMMFPIGLSIIAHLARGARGHQDQVRKFALAMMLITSFAASVGGMGTPVGTPPNLIGIGMLEKIVGAKISFFAWMAIGLPVVGLLFAYLLAQFYFSSVRGMPAVEGGTALVKAELQKLGAMTIGQRNTLIAFAVTVLLWILPGFFALAGVEQSAFARRYTQSMPEGIAAMVGALLLFVLPVDWKGKRFTITGRSGSHRLGHRAPVRRRARGGGAGVLHGAGPGAGRGHHVVAAVAVHAGAHRDLHVRRHRGVGGSVQHRVGQHDHPDCDRRLAGGGRAAHRARPGRHPGRQHGLHDAHLHTAQRHRLQLGIHPDRPDDAPRGLARPGGVRRDRLPGDDPGAGALLTPWVTGAGRRDC
ncbi:MAG: SLC13 family permease [Vicinamibacterales bacterium]